MSVPGVQTRWVRGAGEDGNSSAAEARRRPKSNGREARVCVPLVCARHFMDLGEELVIRL